MLGRVAEGFGLNSVDSWGASEVRPLQPGPYEELGQASEAILLLQSEMESFNKCKKVLCGPGPLSL